MTEPLTSCSRGSNWYMGNGSLSEASRLMNNRLDLERDIRYWNRDIDKWDDEPYPEEMGEDEYECEPVEMPPDEPEEPGSPLTPQARGSASKRNKVKLTGKTSFYSEDFS